MSERVDAIMTKNAQRNEEYKKFVEKSSPKQNTLSSLLKAALVGGLICCLGQVFFDLCITFLHTDKVLASGLASLALIFLTVLFTGLGIFDKLGNFAGGGTFLPITGFANSIASSAIEFKSEGMIFGLCVKYFTVAGPVIVNGILGGFLVGIVYWIISLF